VCISCIATILAGLSILALIIIVLDGSKFNDNFFKFNQANTILIKAKRESPANIVAMQLIQTMEDIPVLKEILEDFRRANPNELAYTISKVTKYLEEQKTNILRKDKTLKQELNNSMLSEVAWLIMQRN
jgi:hypothetical protein